MGSKAISSTVLSDTLTLSLCKDGYWLHDKACGMNLAMRAKTEVDACVEAITYYQKRLAKVSAEYTVLNDKVEHFLSQFPQPEEHCPCGF